jgi:cell division protein FtsB
MRNFEKKGKLMRILESQLVLVILAGALLFSLWSLVGFWQKMNETSKKRKMAEEKVLELKEGKEKLEIDIEKLQSDRGIEEILREDFGLAREGEGVIVVVEDQNKEAEKPESGGFWGFWRSLFQ